jgi:hypothetical protein
MTVREIRAFLSEQYGTDVSPDFISSVTDEVMAEIGAWQQRPLEPMYPVIFFDALRVKIREEGLVRNKAIYLALGVLPERHVMSGHKVHADDTPIGVLAPGNGKTKTARLWTYVRDDRPAGYTTPAAVWLAYSPDRKGQHPRAHLKSFSGILQADGYAGFAQLYASGTIQEAACWLTPGVSFTMSTKTRPRRLQRGAATDCGPVCH